MAISTATAHRVSAARQRALKNAQRRARSAGASLFIVAMTLGLLAAMGVYGLSATAFDVRSAGHLREAVQAQSAAEHAIMLTAESFTPGTAGEIVRAMQSGKGTTTDIQSTKCRTANSFDSQTNTQYRAAQACLSWSEAEMMNIAKSINPWIPGSDKSTFSTESFGQVPQRPYLRIEITNPVDIPPPPGMSLNDRYTFTQLTVTTFVDMKSAGVDTAATTAASSSVQARGRITVGPYFRL